ncbi:MAG: NYN domain-containing protein [Anaerolineae bacterium]|nr:NYN domain-containing protein [Anaerolineae bacterium]
MNNDVAIFLDLDNVVIGATEVNLTFDVNLLLNHVKRFTNGRVVLRYAYGEWRQHDNIPRALATAGFELQSAVRLGQASKNLVDMQLVVDAMETLVDGHNFSTYVVVTGDRDFVPLVSALRKRGKQVIGIGLRHTTSQSLVDLCDRYFYYDDLVKTVQQEQVDKIGRWVQAAADELLPERERVSASLFKEKMRALSQGELDKMPQVRESFRKLLEQYPQFVQVELDGSTLYVSRPQTTPSPPLALPAVASTPSAAPSPTPKPAKPAKPERKASEAELRQWLRQSLDELGQGKKHIRASLLKERLQALNHGHFNETQYGVANFRAFLEKFDDLLVVELQGSTLFVSRRPDETEAAAELHEQYRHSLKKRGLRVVPAPQRLQILKETIFLLQAEGTVLWKTVVDSIAEKYSQNETLPISKGQIHDTLRIARRAEIINPLNGSKSLANDPLQLQLQSSKLFQDAVMLCDATYLQELKLVFGELDLNEAALALYDSKGHERYLKVVLNQIAN